MKITNFEHTGLDKVEEFIKKEDISENELRECLKYSNVYFILEGINRVQSTLICELKDSYVQQSQRYVTMKEDSFTLPELEKEDSDKARKLIDEAFKLYNNMSQLKEGEFKGRPKAENYLYGIPIEDARYILPMAVKTNVSVSMSGNKLIDLFALLNDSRYAYILGDIKKELKKFLPVKLSSLLLKVKSNYNIKLIEDYYKTEFDKIDNNNRMVLINAFNNLDLKAGLGAITSSNEKKPSEVLENWGEEAQEKAKSVANRVLGYGHESIAEQARTTFGMMCSMVTYHQQLRHRLSENHREELSTIIKDMERPVQVPPTIIKSKFNDKFLELTKEFKNFRRYISEKYSEEKAVNFLLNCDQVKLIISTNARIDVKMLAERICLNAQWEIRELSTKKLEILRELSEILYTNALPSCVYGKCKEGKLTCGKQMFMKEKFMS